MTAAIAQTDSREPVSESRDPAQRIALLDPARFGWVTVAELAKALNLTARAIQKACQHGRIQARKPQWSKGWLIPSVEAERLALEKWGGRHDG